MQHDHIDGSLNFSVVARGDWNFPGRSQYLIQDFDETGIPCVSRMKLDQPGRPLLIQQKVAYMIRSRFCRRKGIKDGLSSNSKIFSCSTVTNRSGRNEF